MDDVVFLEKAECPKCHCKGLYQDETMRWCPSMGIDKQVKSHCDYIERPKG